LHRPASLLEARTFPRRYRVGKMVRALFLLTLFFAPLAEPVPGYAAAQALFFVACLMARGFAELNGGTSPNTRRGVVIARHVADLLDRQWHRLWLNHLHQAGLGRWRDATASILVLAVIFVVEYAFFWSRNRVTRSGLLGRMAAKAHCAGISARPEFREARHRVGGNPRPQQTETLGGRVLALPIFCSEP
jgi:hypothetical protein